MAGIRVAIVGAGPAGLYAAEALAQASDPEVEVDLIDRLPVPFGLVRYGVAPDHASIRSVRDTLAQILHLPRVRFLGGVEIGEGPGCVSAHELRAAYDAVVWAYGAARDRRLGVPGEDLPGSIAATDLVAWYTGHPDADGGLADVLAGVERAVVVGAGNVALDVVRLLATPAQDLRSTDMPDAVLAALAATRMRSVTLLARRGPAQAPFTTKELRELGDIPGARVLVDAADLEPVAGAAAPDRSTARNLDVLRGWAAETATGTRIDIALRFCSMPVALEAGADGRVAGVIVERTVVGADGSARATGERSLVPADLVVRAVGYRGVPIPGVPFDEASATVPSDGTRVAPGEYATGWVRRGPTGVIGTNRKCGNEAAAALLEDARSGALRSSARAGIDPVLQERGIEPTTAAGWVAVDAAERELGQRRGSERVTIADRAALLSLGRSASAARLSGG